MSKTIQNILTIAFIGAVFMGLVIWMGVQTQTAVGSVDISNEYNATTTSTISPMPTGQRLTATSTTDRASYQGTFGSFVQTAAGSAGGNINIYDATTTSVLLRDRAMGTSSILIASLPTNATVGTYTYDVTYSNGLLVVIDGTVGTTTMTWRR